MGIVKISEQMHENLRLASGALSRSINAQAEHWLRIGMVAELNPGLSYSETCKLLIQAELPKNVTELTMHVSAPAGAA